MYAGSPVELDRLQPRDQLAVERAALHAGELRSEAEVRAEAERHVLVRVAADIELVGVVEDVLVAVRGRIREQHRLPGLDCTPRSS